MTIKEFTKQETALLASSNSILIEQGKAYKEIIYMYKKFSGLWLSDDVLISDLAQSYIEKQLRECKFVSDKKNYNIRIQCAKKLIKKNFLTYDDLKLKSKDYNLRGKTFEDMRNALKNTDYYDKIRPEVLFKILLENS